MDTTKRARELVDTELDLRWFELVDRFEPGGGDTTVNERLATLGAIALRNLGEIGGEAEELILALLKIAYALGRCAPKDTQPYMDAALLSMMGNMMQGILQ